MGLRFSYYSNALADAGVSGVKKILAGLVESTCVLSEFARASDEVSQSSV